MSSPFNGVTLSRYFCLCDLFHPPRGGMAAVIYIMARPCVKSAYSFARQCSRAFFEKNEEKLITLADISAFCTLLPGGVSILSA